MKTLDKIIPKQATPCEVAIILVHYMFPNLSKKQIAAIVNLKNPQRPRMVQQVFKKYNLVVIQHTRIEHIT
jgi:hypothetical protein